MIINGFTTQMCCSDVQAIQASRAEDDHWHVVTGLQFNILQGESVHRAVDRIYDWKME